MKVNIKYMNLSEGFNPFYNESKTIPEALLRGKYIKFEKFTFKGGEPHIKLDIASLAGKVDWVYISHRINSFNDMGELMVAVDALRREYPRVTILLFLPYFPGARQDRIMVDGEPFTAKIYADLINDMNFDHVTILDPHSDVAPALLNKVQVVENHPFVLSVLKDIYPQVNAKTPILISPDAGSNKKVMKLAKYLSEYNVMDIVKCDKTRDVKTGEITNFEVYADDLEGRDCIIVDDICDGGGTFLGLGAKLKEKNCGKLYLVVTHGIFSSGFKNLNGMFEMVYTTDSIQNYDDTFREAHKHHKGFEAKVKEIKINSL